MKGFKFSPIHLPPVHRVKVKRTHYRVILVTMSVVIWVCHEVSPGYEMHMVFLTNVLFALDPTV